MPACRQHATHGEQPAGGVVASNSILPPRAPPVLPLYLLHDTCQYHHRRRTATAYPAYGVPTPPAVAVLRYRLVSASTLRDMDGVGHIRAPVPRATRPPHARACARGMRGCISAIPPTTYRLPSPPASPPPPRAPTAVHASPATFRPCPPPSRLFSPCRLRTHRRRDFLTYRLPAWLLPAAHCELPAEGC